ncbi:MAG: nuclear transport factor 2 family protein [Candidatus Heimdallarchaeota archaeon]|nr:nuclear transport factor 2 family protein [Candidatus Heimdallarchaeota archaeon]
MIGTIVAKKKAKKAFDNLNKKDIEGLLKDWTDTTKFHYPGNTKVSGSHTGLTQISMWFENLFNHFENILFDVKYISCSRIFDFFGNNILTVIFDVHITKKDGTKFANFGITKIEIKNRKVIDVRDFFFDMNKLEKGWNT